MQAKNGITQSGVVNRNDWIALGSNKIDTTKVSVFVLVDGITSIQANINKTDLPTGWDGGQYGTFVRGFTKADFEYLYGFRGSEEMVDDGDNGMLSKVTGSYFSDQSNKAWVYDREKRYIIRGGKRILRNS